MHLYYYLGWCNYVFIGCSYCRQKLWVINSSYKYKVFTNILLVKVHACPLLGTLFYAVRAIGTRTQQPVDIYRTPPDDVH